jgi:hypothetical protein
MIFVQTGSSRNADPAPPMARSSRMAFNSKSSARFARQSGSPGKPLSSEEQELLHVANAMALCFGPSFSATDSKVFHEILAAVIPKYSLVRRRCASLAVYFGLRI